MDREKSRGWDLGTLLCVITLPFKFAWRLALGVLIAIATILFVGVLFCFGHMRRDQEELEEEVLAREGIELHDEDLERDDLERRSFLDLSPEEKAEAVQAAWAAQTFQPCTQFIPYWLREKP